MEKCRNDSISIRGYSHILAGTERQDCSVCVSQKKRNKQPWYYGTVVCDGHGGEKYIRSAIGSQLACEVGRDAIGVFMSKIRPTDMVDRNRIDASLCQLERWVIQQWREKVLDHCRKCPVEKDERFAALPAADQEALRQNPIKAYGTTFIAAVMTTTFTFAIKVGDGDVAVVNRNMQVQKPEELEDEEMRFNITTSLSDQDANVHFRHFYRGSEETHDVKGITVTTDGVINCFSSHEAFDSFILNVCRAYEEDSVEVAHQELKSALEILSQKGSGDDLSLGLMVKRK